MCTAKEQCKAPEATKSSNHLYSADFNKYFSAIELAVAAYVSCNNTNCNCHADVLRADLKPFKAQGITLESINRAKQYGTHYQIVDRKLYRQRECMFPARCSGVEHFVKPLLPLLPNMDLIVNCRDWPQIHRHWSKEKIP
uniref:CAP10 domain-containing protein n=1 Tax=Anopheles maculatus TaxID=74869 RepID=A0A182SQY4_9DIPT